MAYLRREGKSDQIRGIRKGHQFWENKILILKFGKKQTFRVLQGSDWSHY